MTKKQIENLLIDRDLSWVSFNGRVLQEAVDPKNPLLERIKFLAIFSNNLDEFFRVRFSGLKRLSILLKQSKSPKARQVNDLMRRIRKEVTLQQDVFDRLLRKDIVRDLKKLGINWRVNKKFGPKIEKDLQPIFEKKILPFLKPELIDKNNTVFLKDKMLYHYFLLKPKKGGKSVYGIVNIPSDKTDRFVSIKRDKDYDLFYIDDIIRQFADRLFPKFVVKRCHSVKLSRDADLEIQDEYRGNLIDKIKKSLLRRSIGLPSRLLYDNTMPNKMLWDLQEMYKLEDTDLIEGDRYHNSSDFFAFPNPENRIPSFEPRPQLEHPELAGNKKLLDTILKRDYLAHYPYQNMKPLVNLVAQAAEDPRVQSIKISLYRAAKKSKLLKNIIRAARNGKDVTAFVELKARFDEKPNLKWAAKLEKNNVQVVYSMPGIKVHCKVLLIELLNKKDELQYVSYLSTGNFNEKTAKIYCDHALFTGHQEIGYEIDRIFDMLQGRLLKYDFKHLLVAPHELKRELLERIEQESVASEAGEPAKLIFKVNGLENKPTINKLIRAKDAGVDIDLIVRSTCCLTPLSARGKNNIRIRSIVGRYLEHARVFYFHNKAKPNYYMGSADLMNRNLNRRVEVVFPIYDERLQEQLQTMFDLQLADNTKARKIAKRGTNTFLKNKKAPLNSQDAFYRYLKKLQK